MGFGASVDAGVFVGSGAWTAAADGDCSEAGGGALPPQAGISALMSTPSMVTGKHFAGVGPAGTLRLGSGCSLPLACPWLAAFCSTHGFAR